MLHTVKVKTNEILWRFRGNLHGQRSRYQVDGKIRCMTINHINGESTKVTNCYQIYFLTSALVLVLRSLVL